MVAKDKPHDFIEIVHGAAYVVAAALAGATVYLVLLVIFSLQVPS